MEDQYHALVDRHLVREPLKSGKLNGFTYAVKDVIAIKGYSNTAGNPDWHRSHRPAEQNATVINLLLQNGARLMGAAHTDELMYSLNGENFYYGTPVNPQAPDRIPGGSSSGSAVAVSAGMVDFSLGTDTGGSVRIPSSYCGIYGIRPTHGSVSMDGVIPLAPSFDTLGWMANDPVTLQAAGEVLLNEAEMEKTAGFQQAFLAEETWALLDEEAHQELSAYLPAVEKEVSALKKVSISAQGLDVWADTFRILQGLEIGKVHGEWIINENPRFGPGIAERFAWTQTLKKEDYQEQLELRHHIRESLDALLGKEGVLILPTAPGAAPKVGLSTDELEEKRKKTMQLSCIAGLAGLPQISLPLGSVEEKPIGLSLMAGRNQDKNLLELAVSLCRGLSRSQPSLK